MKLHILRLGSVVPEGVGGPDAGSIDLLYSFLLQEYKCDYYDHIHINQIGNDLEEMIMKVGRKIKTNIIYPTTDFEKKTISEKNIIRLDVVHKALLRIARKENKLDVNNLEKIRDLILEHDFEFDLLYKQFDDKKNQLSGKILIHPHQEKFCFYFSAEKNGQVVGKVLLYEGKCTDYYIPTIFFKGKWRGENEFVINDKNKEIELHIFLKENRVELINLTRYERPPFFEIMKAGKSDENAYKDWLHSLPPGAAGIITHGSN